MINRLKLIESLQGYKSRKALLEYNYKELTAMSDDKRKTRAKTIPAFYKYIDQGKDGHARTHWDVPGQTDKTKTYHAIVELHVPIIGGLFAIAKEKWNMKRFMEIFTKSDVKVYCSCPDFFWGGQKYNLGPNGQYKGALSPGHVAGHRYDKEVVSKAPDIRDPNRKHILCKHLLAVMSVFPSNASDIMSQARKFDNNRKTDDSISREMDDGKSPIKEEIQTYNVEDSEKAILNDTLNKSVETLSVNNPETSGANDLIKEENEIEDEEKDADSLINTENEIATNEVEIPIKVEPVIEPVAPIAPVPVVPPVISNEPRNADSLINKPVTEIKPNADSLINDINKQSSKQKPI